MKSLVRNGSSLLLPALVIGAAVSWISYKNYKKSKGPAIPTTTPTTPPPTVSGIGSYYDVSAAGAPYQGMLGLGNNAIQSVNTIIPTDAIRRASDFPWVHPVTRQFAEPVVRTGGTFSRDLFTGTDS